MLSSKILEALQSEVAQDCVAFLPELILSGGIVLLLLLRLFSAFNRWHLGWVALVVTLGALGTSYAQWSGCCLTSPDQFFSERHSADIFGGMLIYDYFTVYLRFFLLAFAACMLWL